MRSTSSRTLEDWEALPIAAPLGSAREAAGIRRAWTPIRVPWHWQLEDAFATYEGIVLYRCRFAQQRPTEGTMLSLRFEGVYYAARVWLNGVYLGEHEGYFSAFEFDITDVVVSAGENELLVEVCSPEESDENDRKTVGGVWARWDGMAPHINPGGIFREVTVVVDGEVRIRSLGAAADHSGRGVAHVDLYSRYNARARLVGRVRPLGFSAPDVEFEREVQVEGGENRLEIGFRVPDVRVWSTWDRGEQPLYELVLWCAGAEERTRFGASTVELRDWKVYLNGERIFLRGINYLPSDAYPARATEELLRADASLVREAGMNAVRVHAHVSDREFYEACDELGLLVVQDFPLQWTHRRSILGPAVTQAGEMARILRGNASVGIYLAHDEPFFVAPPEKWSPLGLLRTAAEVLSPRWMLWQRRVLDPAVVRAISEEDDSRPVIDAAGHPLTTNHLYFGWYYGKFRDLERVVKVFPGFPRLPTEYGAQALPDPESLEEIWPSGTRPDWSVLSLNYRLQVQRITRYVPWRGDRATFLRESQRYQAEVLKHATELFRRRKYRPTGGTFAFMLNDPAPAVSWSVVDWRRRPKIAYETLLDAMRPVLICAEYPKERYSVGDRISLPLFVINDLSRELGIVDWSWELFLGGSSAAHGGGETTVPKDSVVRIGEAVATLSTSGPAVLRLTLFGEEGPLSNEYEFVVSQAGARAHRGPSARGG
ncbi:MAG TPA: glycoside hydrolase family 2 TIM barrel-domain containing protein [Rubrobacter sp.]|nr:glycoside hydrolase family 2 TIM barrel-domain containing protein [Rubrobacter sp.]